MRVLHITTDDTGGAGLCCLRIHKALLDMGVKRTVLAIEKSMKQQYNVPLSNFVKDNYGWETIADKTKEYLLNIL